MSDRIIELTFRSLVHVNFHNFKLLDLFCQTKESII